MKISHFGLPLITMSLGVEAVVVPRAKNLNFSIIVNPIPSVVFGQVVNITYTSTLDNNALDFSGLVVSLLMTSDVQNTSQATTTFLAEVLGTTCIYHSSPSDCGDSATNQIPEGPRALPMELSPLQQGLQRNPNLDNVFLCFGTIDQTSAGHICNYYSSIFSIYSSPGIGDGGSVPSSTPTGIMTVTNTDSNFAASFSLQGPAAFATAMQPVPSLLSSSSSFTTTSTSTSYTRQTTGIALSTATPTTGLSGSPSPIIHPGSSGLSIGAKVGIALGAIVVFGLILLAVLFCLRRKHAKRASEQNQPPEQVMLTQSMHTDSFANGRAGILAEKEEVAASISATAAGNPTINEPETRHSAVAPYVPLPSLPYSGTAATVPRRKPTTVTVGSTVSRNISSASGLSSGPLSPRSTTASGDEYSPYHDAPVYGDARHSPQVFTSGERALGGASSPFVTEEMSPEEVARLEEEERRIDAAIAEAERR